MKTVKIMLVYNLSVKIIELTFKPAMRRLTGQIVEAQPAGGIQPNFSFLAMSGIAGQLLDI